MAQAWSAKLHLRWRYLQARRIAFCSAIFTLRSVARRRGAAQPVVDRRAKAVARNWRDRDRDSAGCVEGPQMSEQIGRRFGEVAARRQIEPRRSPRSPAARRRNRAPPRMAPPHAHRAERPRAARNARRAGPARAARAAWRRPDARAARRARLRSPPAESRRARSRRGAAAEAGDDRRIRAPKARGAAVEDEIDAAVEIGEHMGGARRADAAGAVGRRGDQRRARRRDQRPRDRMARRAQARRLSRPARAKQADVRACAETGVTSVSGPGQKASASTRACGIENRLAPAAPAMSRT